ncbi:hypothetical protein HJ590_17705 [Naumannella sp. ID2617S]|nr:hypothetical protein [Naumannella sp. ID2617S]
MQADSSGGGTAGDAVLSRTCDAGILTDIIGGINTIIDGFQGIFDTAMGFVQNAIDWANRLTLGTIPWLDDVLNACKEARQAVNRAIDKIQEGLKGLEAPWYMKCVGEKLRDGMGPRIEGFAQSLDPATLRCKQSWKGKGADAFFASADKQKKAADETLSGVPQFGDRMVQMADQGIVATVAFLFAIVILSIKIAIAIAKLPAVPAGTLLGTVELWALVAECIALIAAFVAYVLNASSQAERFTASVRDVPMKGAWPQPAA